MLGTGGLESSHNGCQNTGVVTEEKNRLSLDLRHIYARLAGVNCTKARVEGYQIRKVSQQWDTIG